LRGNTATSQQEHTGSFITRANVDRIVVTTRNVNTLSLLIALGAGNKKLSDQGLSSNIRNGQLFAGLGTQTVLQKPGG